MGTTPLVSDVIERNTGPPKPPTFPSPPTANSGHPQHKTRWRPINSKPSPKHGQLAVSSSRSPTNEASAVQPSHPPSHSRQGYEEAEKRGIDLENRRKIAQMSPQEIAQAQEDIFNGLSPALVQRLLQRVSLKDPETSASSKRSERGVPLSEETESQAKGRVHDSGKVDGEVETVLPSLAADCDSSPEPSSARPEDLDDRAPAQPPPDLFPITNQPIPTHFPKPPTLPDLDPSDPNFLDILHKKYFPNLPADPSRLAWMAPVPSTDSAADKQSPYYPHPEINLSALRFDFRGRFLSPRVSRSLPTTKGLHHHGEAPEAAGYTVAELARLARSVVPSQRCLAYQTLGRILYRLGKGEWGRTEDDPIAMGVWSSVKQGRVVQTLMEAAAGEGGHRGSRAYATEALWLFHKGGWTEKHKGR